MGLIALWLRWEIRRRWRTLGVLTLLMAFSVAVVATALAGALRAGSAIDRLAARTSQLTVALLPTGNQPVPWDRIRALPQVAASSLITESGLSFAGVAEDDERFTLPADAGWMHTLERPVVLAGRLPDPAAATEIAVTPGFLEANRMHLGSRLQPSLDAPGGKAGPLPALTVVGVVRSTRIADAAGAQGRVELTPAFYRAFAAAAATARETPYLGAYIRLQRGGADLPAFEQALHAIDPGGDIDVQAAGAQLQRPRDVIGFEVRFLLAFGAAALLAAALLLGQAMAREVAATADDVRSLGALGAGRSRQLVLAASGPALAGLAGIPFGLVASVPASGWFPIGTAAYYEPAPGVLVDLRVLAGTLLLAPVLVLAGAWAVAALTRWRRALSRYPQPVTAPRGRRSPLAALVRRGAPVTATVGARVAWTDGRGGTLGLTGVVAGILATAAALAVAAGLGEATTNPARFGAIPGVGAWISDSGSVPPAVQPLLAKAAADPDVRALSTVGWGITTAGTGERRVGLDVYGDGPLKGTLPIVLTTGRTARSDAEIVLGAESAARVGAAVGSSVRVGSLDLVISGIGFVPESWRNSYASGAWTTQAGWRRLFAGGSGVSGTAAFATFRPGVARTPATRALNARLGLSAADGFQPPAPVQRIADLRQIRQLPVLFAAFLGLLTVGTLAHVLVVALRRQSGQLALLRALGMTPGQTRTALAWQGALVAVAGAVAGLPLGIAAGRTLWQAVADATPVQYAPPALTGALLLVPAALLVAWLVLAGPGWWVARARIADVLRAE